MDCSFSTPFFRSTTFVKANWLEFVYASESITDVLGFEQHHVLQRGITDLVDDYEQEDVARALNTIVRENKAASLLYLHLLHAQQQRFIVCQMTISVAGNVIVGSICQAALDAIGSTARDQSAEELIVAVNESVSYPGISVCHCPRTGLGLDIDDLWAAAEVPCNRWTGTRFPRTALLLDRFSADCIITHCTNNAILDNESCVERRGGLFRYVAPQDEASNFITRLKQSGIEANAPTNVGFVYHTFNLCVAGRDSQASCAGPPNGANEIRVSAVGSASSDGLTLVLKLEP
ncbi:PAS fold [Rhizoctonia solani]|uniref:PAS fold n=1 Tax=Rhizoctonia solani TaxID=456999 RepID=A0A8H7IM55_9AGAM|nr:PAS fold [Rhizoctonia solani]